MQKLSVIFALLISLVLPSFASAVYGCGTYGSGTYNNDCPSTSATSTASTDGTETTAAITANGIVLEDVDDATQTPEFNQNSPIEFSGTAYPFAEVHLYFHSVLFEATTNADKDGRWSYTLTHDLGAGDHTLTIALKKQDEQTIGTESEPFAFVISPVSSATTTTAPTKSETTANYIWIYIAGVSSALIAGLVIWLLMRRRNRQSTV